MSESSAQPKTPPTPGPSLLEALIPVSVLIVLLAISVWLYGLDSSGGAIQVSLFTAATVAALMAASRGVSYDSLRIAAVEGISAGLSAIFILLAVGALLGAWNMGGTIATVIYYGLDLLKPSYFYFAVCILCAVTGLVTGSSWTTAGTLGVAFIGIGQILGLDPAITAGAAISGAYMGDKMCPLSETTVLVPSITGATVSAHIRAMIWTVVPSFVIASVLFLILSLQADVSSTAIDTSEAKASLDAVFNIGPLTLAPIVLLIALSALKFPPFIAIYLTAIASSILACFTQPDVVDAFVNDPGLGTIATSIQAIISSMANGFSLDSGVPQIDKLFSGGGMSSMLTTLWLIVGALAFGAVMERGGYLHRLVEPLIAHANTPGKLSAAVAGSAIGLNVIAGDQYVADVIPARTFSPEFKRQGYRPETLSRIVEDNGTVTSVLIPWNTCGAYHAAVLGVATFDYLPYCFFNLINPALSIVYGFFNFRMIKFDEVPSDVDPVVPASPVKGAS
ncbi:MAG TPA: Na+/H+ antiporter NhaC family protein [Thermomicrobiales bacterium]|nr:Na+/H+ antiporter NhaC family protein [Thermomicrobiales bacterium]